MLASLSRDVLVNGVMLNTLSRKGKGMAQKQIVNRTQIAEMEGTVTTHFLTAALVLSQNQLMIVPDFKHSGFI